MTIDPDWSKVNNVCPAFDKRGTMTFYPLYIYIYIKQLDLGCLTIDDPCLIIY